MFGRIKLDAISPARVGFDYSKLKARNLVKLDANEVEFFDEKLKLIAADALMHCDLGRYPDPNSTEVRNLIAADLNIPTDSIVVGNGSDELLNNIFFAFFGMKVMIPDISYPVYYHLANLNEMKIHKINLTKNYDLPDDIDNQVKEFNPNIIFLSYPNNPTGTLFNRKAIVRMIDRFPETVFVIDEAYYEFCEKTFIEYAFSRPNVIILRTFSKIFSLAGLRVGYAIAGNAILDLLLKTKLIYSVSGVSQAIICALHPKIKEHISFVRDSIISERKLYEKKLSNLFTTPAAKGSANFVFVPIPENLDYKKIEKSLHAQNIFIRFMPYDDAGVFLRFSLGLPENNKRAYESLERLILDQKKGEIDAVTNKRENTS